MSKYIENVNAYLSQMKIKQTFISLKTGIEPSKLSRILKGTQDVTITDMEQIAAALGKRTEEFLQDDFQVESHAEDLGAEIVFYAGRPGADQERFAMKLLELMENADEVLGAKSRLMLTIEE